MKHCAAFFLAFLTLAAAALAADKPYDMYASHAGRPLLIVAHRGVKKFAPENTLPAIEKAIDMKLDFVEIDVRTTKDGRLVLMHDAEVDRTTTGKGPVRQLTLEQIRQLDAGVTFSQEFKGTPVPTFEEVLRATRGRINIYVDWKDADPAALAKAIASENAYDHVLVLGDIFRLLSLHRADKKIHLMAEMEKEEDAVRLFRAPLKFEALSPIIWGLTEKMVTEAHKRNIKVLVDAFSPETVCDDVNTVIRTGTDGIQTDSPDIVLYCLEQAKTEK